MSESKMREEFEAWANDKGFCLDCRFFEEGNNFEEADTALAFEIWQASRAALVIELPETPNRGVGYGLFDAGKEACRAAIEAAGVKATA